MAQRPTVTQMSRKFESHAFTIPALLSTYKEMYGNTCRTLLSQHLLIKALFE